MLGLLDGELRDRFHREKEIDFSFSWREQIRFRANVFRQQGTVALALRAIPFDIPTFDELGLPPIMEYFAGLPQGLLLVTGPTGSGQVDHAGVGDRLHQPHTASATSSPSRTRSNTCTCTSAPR